MSPLALKVSRQSSRRCAIHGQEAAARRFSPHERPRIAKSRAEACRPASSRSCHTRRLCKVACCFWSPTSSKRMRERLRPKSVRRKERQTSGALVARTGQPRCSQLNTQPCCWVDSTSVCTPERNNVSVHRFAARDIVSKSRAARSSVCVVLFSGNSGPKQQFPSRLAELHNYTKMFPWHGVVPYPPRSHRSVLRNDMQRVIGQVTSLFDDHLQTQILCSQKTK